MEIFAGKVKEVDIKIHVLEIQNITSTREIAKQELERALYVLRLKNDTQERD